MYSNKAILSLSYPIFFSLLAQSVINVTDSAFLGWIGEVELGASALGGVFYFAVFVIGMGFTTGAQILIGRRNGEQDRVKAGEVFNQGMMAVIFLAMLIFGLSYYFTDPILHWFIRSEEIYAATALYMKYRIFGFLFAFVNLMFRALYVGILRTKVLTAGGFITMGVNVLLSYSLIFGHFGMPKMGIAGAALASVLAEFIAFLFYLSYTLMRGSFRSYHLFRFSQVHFKTIGKILDLSLYIMLQSFLSISTWFLFFIFIEKMGDRPLAVSNIIRSLYSFLGLPVITLGIVINTVVSNLIGEGKMNEVMASIRRMIALSLLFTAPIMLITALFPMLFASIYTNEMALRLATIPSLHVFSLILLTFAVGNILFNAVSGTGNTRMALLFEFLIMFAYLAYIYSVIFVFHASVAIAWCSEIVYWTGLGLMSYVYFRRGSWQKTKI
ncbi:MAG: MATE family efflux transporter [Microbacter sp.]